MAVWRGGHPPPRPAHSCPVAQAFTSAAMVDYGSNDPAWVLDATCTNARLSQGQPGAKAVRCCRLVDEMGQPIGPYRVWLQRTWVPGLAMSRALGDKLAHRYDCSCRSCLADLLQEHSCWHSAQHHEARLEIAQLKWTACRVGVTTQPEVKVIELTPNDSFIVLASDGVWEFISNQEVVDIIADARTVEEGCRAVSFGPLLGADLATLRPNLSRSRHQHRVMRTAHYHQSQLVHFAVTDHASGSSLMLTGRRRRPLMQMMFQSVWLRA